MTARDKSHKEIEQLRRKMYQAYEHNESYEKILAISTELDRVLIEKMRSNNHKLFQNKHK